MAYKNIMTKDQSTCWNKVKGERSPLCRYERGWPGRTGWRKSVYYSVAWSL